MTKKNQHVVPHGKDCGVKGEKNEKYTSFHSTQKEAIDKAKDIAKNQKSELVIHNKQGQIRNKDSYGTDPCPPKDI